MSSVAGAAASGDRRALLVALRDRIAPVLDGVETHPRDLNVLSGRLLDVVREIEEIDVRAENQGAALAVVDDEFDPRAV